MYLKRIFTAVWYTFWMFIPALSLLPKEHYPCCHYRCKHILTPFFLKCVTALLTARTDWVVLICEDMWHLGASRTYVSLIKVYTSITEDRGGGACKVVLMMREATLLLMTGDNLNQICMHRDGQVLPVEWWLIHCSSLCLGAALF